MSKPQCPAPLYEPACVSLVFVDELSVITTLGSITHLIFSAQRRSIDDGRAERVVEARLIIPTDRLQAIGRALLAGQVHTVPVDAFGEPAELH